MNTVRNRWVIAIVGLLTSALWVRHSKANAPMGHYQVTANTVFDTKSKLTWQRVASTPAYTLSEAQTYCQNLDLDGTGWRIPSMKELMTIVDDTRTYPAIDTAAFPNAPTAGFWTSSARVNRPGETWYIQFDFGDTGSNDAFTTHRLRCVR